MRAYETALVTLPNGERHRYGRYTLPCCVDCNDEMSRVFETPLSEAFACGFAAVESMVRREGADLLFRWLALIFLKYHLKDQLLRRHLDDRKGDERISSGYKWGLFHHLHSLSRSHHSGAALGRHVVGTMVLMRGSESDGESGFDACTVTDASTIYLRLGDVIVFAVLNDAQASAGAIDEVLRRITGPLNAVQARELAAELAAANLHLENRPRYSTTMSDTDGSDQAIRAAVEGGPRFIERDDSVVGYVKCALLHHYFGNVSGMAADEVERQMRANRFTFLWDHRLLVQVEAAKHPVRQDVLPVERHDALRSTADEAALPFAGVADEAFDAAERHPPIRRDHGSVFSNRHSAHVGCSLINSWRCGDSTCCGVDDAMA